MREVTVQLYAYPELPEKTREKVREQIISNGWVDQDIHQDLTAVFTEVLKENGFSGLINDMGWSLSHCQGDGVAFYGKVNLIEFLAAKNIWSYWPELQEYKELIGDLSINVVPNNNFYNHYNSMCIESDFYSRPDIPKFLIEAIRSLVDSVHDMLRNISRRLKLQVTRSLKTLNQNPTLKKCLK